MKILHLVMRMAQNIGKHGLQILLLVDLCGKILPPFDNRIPHRPIPLRQDHVQIALPMQSLPTRQVWVAELWIVSGVLQNHFLSGKEPADGLIRKRERTSPRFWMKASEL